MGRNKDIRCSRSQWMGSLLVSLQFFVVHFEFSNGNLKCNPRKVDFRNKKTQFCLSSFEEIRLPHVFFAWLPHWLPLVTRRHRDYSFKCSASASLCPARLRGEAVFQHCSLEFPSTSKKSEKSPTIV